MYNYLKGTIEGFLGNFYREAFGIERTFKVKVKEDPTPFISYNWINREINIPILVLLDIFEGYLGRDLDHILERFSEVLHESIHDIFNFGRESKGYELLTQEGLATIISEVYYRVGKRNLDKFRNFSDFQNLISKMNKEITKSFRDREEMEKLRENIVLDLERSYMNNHPFIGRSVIDRLNEISDDSPFKAFALHRLPVYLILKEFSIEDYLRDIRAALEDSEFKERVFLNYLSTIRKYHERSS
ncbi:MAG: hypothetical protein BXU00_00925 [Candidatus Nanoclepta minutus]|uniref:Uncharacterized protein n=1 Tax=Candidatus Nanoclepta minutus TaxID=1940235 RepID=A0A397WQ78_9ARCH|nr:MAG: hypothetical protein BXU00_00925 [Candidatus Nanoclepta minutus]